jgi:hypothetical protein
MTQDIEINIHPKMRPLDTTMKESHPHPCSPPSNRDRRISQSSSWQSKGDNINQQNESDVWVYDIPAVDQTAQTKKRKYHPVYPKLKHPR